MPWITDDSDVRRAHRAVQNAAGRQQQPTRRPRLWTNVSGPPRVLPWVFKVGVCIRVDGSFHHAVLSLMFHVSLRLCNASTYTLYQQLPVVGGVGGSKENMAAIRKLCTVSVSLQCSLFGHPEYVYGQETSRRVGHLMFPQMNHRLVTSCNVSAYTQHPKS